MNQKYILTLLLVIVINSSAFGQRSGKGQTNFQTLEGTVVDLAGVSRWAGIVVESGGRKYLVQLYSFDYPKTDPKVIGGDVMRVGTRVRVIYTSMEPPVDNISVLRATRVIKLNSQTVTIICNVDAVEASDTDYHIRLVSGGKLYSGKISFSRMPMLLNRKISSYDEAVALLQDKQLKVSLSNLVYSSEGMIEVRNGVRSVTPIIYGDIVQLAFLSSTGNKSAAIESTNSISRTPNSYGATPEKAGRIWNERRTNTEIIIDLSTDILFDFAKSDIRPDAVPALQRLARQIKQSGKGIIQLNGYTDSIASDEYNLKLSERRAASVKEWLISKGGIEKRRLQTKGYGESQPVAPNTNLDGSDNPEGRQKNRRVEVRIPRK